MRIAPAEECASLFGEWLGFFADNKLKKVSFAGGELVVLAEAPNTFGGAWAPDDTICFNTMSGGAVERARDGRASISLTNGRTRRLLDAPAYYGRYVPTGHLVYAERGKLLAVAFDPAAV